jgi:hypothetical protein
MKAPHRHALLALSICGAVMALQGRDVIRHATDHLPMDAGDPVLNASILTGNARHWPLTGAWWNFPGFHPTSSTLALSEHLMGLRLFATPVVQLTGNPILAYNMLLLATFVLSASASAPARPDSSGCSTKAAIRRRTGRSQRGRSVRRGEPS